MVVWDVFPYWREIQFLGARRRLWNTFAPDVDYRLIACVGDRTHRGTPLPSPHYLALGRAVNVIQRVTLDADHDWARERQQRDCARLALREAGAKLGDMVLLTDADELVDPRKFLELEYLTRFGALKVGMALFYYGTQWRSPAEWIHPVACRMSHIGAYPSIELRTYFRLKIASHAGWHISYVGDDAALDQKLASFAHSEVDTQEHRDRLRDRHVSGLDPYGNELYDQPLESEIASIIFP